MSALKKSEPVHSQLRKKWLKTLMEVLLPLQELPTFLPPSSRVCLTINLNLASTSLVKCLLYLSTLVFCNRQSV